MWRCKNHRIDSRVGAKRQAIGRANSPCLAFPVVSWSWLSVGKKETKDFGNRFLPLVRNDLVNSQGNSTQHQGLIDMIDNVVSWDGKNFGDLALLYSNLQEHYSFFYFQELELPVEILSLHNAAYHFFDFASWRLLTFYE